MKSLILTKKQNRLLNSRQSQAAWKRFNELAEKIRKQWKGDKTVAELLREERGK